MEADNNHHNHNLLVVFRPSLLLLLLLPSHSSGKEWIALAVREREELPLILCNQLGA